MTDPKSNAPIGVDSLADSTEQLQRDIESTREQLGETVEALAHKVNVPARTKESVREAVQTAQVKAGEAVQTAQVKAGELADNATVLANRAVTALPPQARGRVEQLVATVRQRPVPAALVAAGAFLVVVRLFRRGRQAG